MIETALISSLRSTPVVADLVGERVFQVFRPERGPLAALPAIVIQRDSTESVNSTDGASGLVHVFFDIEFYAETIEVVAAIAEALWLWRNDFRGRVNGVHIRDMRLSGLADILGPVIAGRSGPTFGRSYDASIWYIERKPIR
jgi:hypothetical protein